MIQIKNKNLNLDNSIIEILPKYSLIYIFENNITINELFKIFTTSKKIDLKLGHNFINFEALLKLVFLEKKNIFSLVNLIKKVLYVEYKFSENQINEIGNLSDIDPTKLKNELFCNFSDGQKIKIVLLILKFFEDQTIFIDYLPLKKIDIYSRTQILTNLVQNNRLFILYSKDSELQLKNKFFLIKDKEKLQLLEVNKRNNFQYFEYSNNFKMNSGVLKNIEYKLSGKKINISINFKKNKIYAFRYYLSLISNELVLSSVHSELIKSQKDLITHNYSIDLKNINQFVGNINIKISFFKNRLLKNKNVERYNILFLHLRKLKNNTSHYYDKVFK